MEQSLAIAKLREKGVAEAKGIQAIDEAISFLNLRCGDRLGHALALGVNEEEWYQGKANHILISKQAYMDNLVWLYSKLCRYNIVDSIDAQTYIEKRFVECFLDIYQQYFGKGIFQSASGSPKVLCEQRRRPWL